MEGPVQPEEFVKLAVGGKIAVSTALPYWILPCYCYTVGGIKACLMRTVTRQGATA